MDFFDLRYESVTLKILYTTDVMIVTSAVRPMETLTVVQLKNCGMFGKSTFNQCNNNCIRITCRLIIGVVILNIAAIPIIACCCGYYFYKKYNCIYPQNSYGGGYGGGNVGYCSGNVGGGSCPGDGSH